jgi:hypothetical protein
MIALALVFSCVLAAVLFSECWPSWQARLRGRKRRGYIIGPTRRQHGSTEALLRVYAGANPATGPLAETFTASSPSSGQALAERITSTQPPEPSRTTAPGCSTGETESGRGGPTMAARRLFVGAEYDRYFTALEAYQRGEGQWPGAITMLGIRWSKPFESDSL